MSKELREIISDIALSNNTYRDPSTPAYEKIEALWEIGDILLNLDIKKPHALGWAIQKESNGLIKRFTIVRGYKTRLIWVSKELLKKDLGRIRSISNLIEILPLIDPHQEVRKQLSNTQLQDIYDHVCDESSSTFRAYIGKIKQTYAYGSLGKALDRSKHLKAYESLVSELRDFMQYLIALIHSADPQKRELFRSGTSEVELQAFSNMCISLTTKQNLYLYKKTGPSISESKDERFRTLYNSFYALLDKKADYERARLRRLVSPEILAQLSDIVSSLSSEDKVRDYIYRQEISIKM